jgi:hypothetical protein
MSHQYANGDVPQTWHPASGFLRLQMQFTAGTAGGSFSGFIPLAFLPALKGYAGPKAQQTSLFGQPAQDLEGA